MAEFHNEETKRSPSKFLLFDIIGKLCETLHSLGQFVEEKICFSHFWIA